MTWDIKQGDVVTVCAELAAQGQRFHAVLCDPPYGLEFMGKEWDAPHKETSFPKAGSLGGFADGNKPSFARQKHHLFKLANVFAEWGEAIASVLYPGAIVLMFGGTRTWEWCSVGMQMAGFEKWDTLMWLYGSGFPKAQRIAPYISKVCDTIRAWNADIVNSAERLSQKSQPVAGRSIPLSGSALVIAERNTEIANKHVNAIIAELRSCDRHHTSGEQYIARASAEVCTTPSLCLVPTAARSNADQNAISNCGAACFALSDVQTSLCEPTQRQIREDALLKTVGGSGKLSGEQAEDALSVALLDSLKLTILSQSRSFQALDIPSQTDAASAISATITASTAALLISSTDDILKKAIGSWSGHKTTALKPAWEPVLCFKKPLDGTYAECALQYGSGALNVDGGRIAAPAGLTSGGKFNNEAMKGACYGKYGEHVTGTGRAAESPLGRYPANLILDEEAAALLDEQSGILTSNSGSLTYKSGTQNVAFGKYGACPSTGITDSGGASRFFYCAKASSRERNKGLEYEPLGTGHGATPREIENAVKGKRGNIHPTVKPIDLCRYLATLLLPPATSPDSVKPRRIFVPFCGSGSEIIGCLQAGWDEVIGCDKEAQYTPLAEARVIGDAPLFNTQECAE